MSASNKKEAVRTVGIYLGLTVFWGVFSLIYEHFSHGVYSNYMIDLFLFPLIGGVLPFTLLWRLPKVRYPILLARNAWHCGLITLTVGSCLKGIFDIYGTTAPLVRVYWAAGTVLMVFGLGAYLLQKKTAEGQTDKS